MLPFLLLFPASMHAPVLPHTPNSTKCIKRTSLTTYSFHRTACTHTPANLSRMLSMRALMWRWDCCVVLLPMAGAFIEPSVCVLRWAAHTHTQRRTYTSEGWAQQTQIHTHNTYITK